MIKLLYERNYPEQEMLELFRYIDWILKLPETLEQEIQTVVDEYEEAKQVKYVTSVERRAIKKGYEEGQREGQKEGQREGRNQVQREMIVRVLQFRFQAGAQASESASEVLDEATISGLTAQLNQIEEEPSLKRLVDGALEVASFGEFLQLLAEELPAKAD